MIVGPHTPGVIVPQSRPFEYNLDLISSVLQTKQGQYDTAYLGIEKLKRESLNINFINKKEQSKINSFNQRMDDYFGSLSDMGDLSNPGLVQGYTALFNEIGKDKALISRYQTEKGYRAELASIDEKKNSTDPTKAGYHTINHSNYLYRLGQYAESDLDKGDVTVSPYTNYRDIMSEIQGIIKNIPVEKFTIDKPLGNGYTEKHTFSGRDPSKVQGVIQQYLQTDGASQLREQAEYYYRNSVTDPDDYRFLYDRSQSRVRTGISTLEAGLSTLQEDMVGMTGQELVQATERATQMSEKLNSLRAQEVGFDQFMRKDEGDHIGEMLALEMGDTVDFLTNSYGGYAESIEYEPDRAFLSLQNYNLSRAKFETDTQFRSAKLALDQAELGLRQSEVQGISTDEVGTGISFTQTSDPTRLNSEVTYQALEGIVTNLSTITRNPFTFREGVAITDEAYLPVINKVWQNGFVENGASQNPYVQAYSKLLAEGKRMGKSKEASMRYAHQGVERIMTDPQDRQEVEIYNQLQRTIAQQGHLSRLMDTAVNSGDPTAYMEQLPTGMAFQYQRVLTDRDAWKDNKDKSKKAELYRNDISSDIMDVININSPNKSLEDDGFNYVSRIDPTLIKEVDVRPDGTVDVFFKDEAFRPETGEPGDNNYKPAGILHNGYYSTVDENGITQHTTIDDRITVNIPERSILNLHTQLGFSVGLEPYRAKTWSNNGPVDYEIVRDVKGGYLWRIPGVTDQLPESDRQGWVPSTLQPGALEENIINYIRTGE